MFREKLKNDLNGISPDEELLIKVTKMMQEEAQKPREPKRVAFMHLGGMAAAVCMIAVGSIALYNSDGVEASPTVSGSEETKAAAVADSAVPELYVEEAAAEGADNTPAYQAVTEATTEAAAKAEYYVLKEGTEAKASEPITLPDFENKGAYGSASENPATTGRSASFEGITNGREGEIDSLYRIKITGVLEKEQAAQLKGFNADIDPSATFYNAEIQFDYLNGSELSESIILRLSGDNEYNSEYGNPCYVAGDIIATVLQKKGDDEEFRRRFSYAFAYDVYEINGASYFAVRNQSLAEVTEGLTDCFGGEIVSYETTTPNNPAVYYGLYEIEGITDNLRELFGW